jgi:4-hydroxy-tetrahydrodipicolinate synthase
MNHADVCAALTGPIPSLRTPFDRNGNVDYKSLARMIEFKLSAGARALVLTAGDSHYEALSDRQVGEITKFVAKQNNRRAFLVAADYRYSTNHAIAFGKECAEMGVDCLMVLPPDWAKSLTPENLAEHYAAIGEQIPVMMVTNVFIPRGAEFGLNVVKATLRRTDRVVAVKDDMGEAFARHMTALVHDRWAVWAGGRKENHLNMALYGAHGYLSTFLTFAPQVAHDYWRAWQERRIEDATRIITEIDMPFFELITKRINNFDVGIHGTLEVFGLAERWRPKPYTSATDAEIEMLRAWFQEKKLL